MFDQKKLLARNTPLFVQLFLGCYLLADGNSCSAKVENSFGKKKVWMSNFFQKQHLEKFNSATELFFLGSDLDEYARLINRLKGVTSLTLLEEKSILTNLILFDHDEAARLTDEALVGEILRSNRSLFEESFVRASDDGVDITTLSATLIEMADFCAKNVHWDRRDDFRIRASDKTDKIPAYQPYTLEEEKWLRSQFRMMDEANRSVAMGEKLTQEFLSCSAGMGHLPAGHMPEVFAVLKERAWRVSRIHPEFATMSEDDQSRFLEANVTLCQALLAVRAESCSTGIEQLQDGFGEADERLWREKYLPYIANPAGIRKMELAKDPSIPSEILMQHRILVDKLQVLTSSVDMFKLNMLIVLTRPPVSGANPNMDEVHRRYMTLLKRRLTWICQQNRSLGDPDQIISNILASQSLLPQMAKLLQIVTARRQQKI